MNKHHSKTYPVLPVVLVSFVLLFGIPLAAGDASDFDTLLRNALEAKKNESTTPPAKPKPLTPAVPVTPRSEAPKPITPRQTMQLPAKSDPSAGWVAVDSEPAAKSKSPTKPTPTPFSIADSRARASSGATTWDAIPTPPTTDSAEPEKTAQKAASVPADSPWDTVVTTTDPWANEVQATEAATEEPAENVDVESTEETTEESGSPPIDLPSENVANWDAVPTTESTPDEKPEIIPEPEIPAAEPFVPGEKIDNVEPTEPEKSADKETVVDEPVKLIDPAESSVEKETPKQDESKKEELKKGEDLSDVLKKFEEDTPKESASKTTANVKTELPKPLPLENETKKEAPKTPEPSTVVVQRNPRPKTPDFDDDDNPVDRKTLVDASRVGDPYSAEKTKLMYNEIMEGLKVRNMTGKYDMWRNYARSTLRSTAGTSTGSEIDGRLRLSWFQKLYGDVILSVIEVEEFSRQLHDALCGDHRSYAEALTMIRKKLDVPDRNDNGVEFLFCATPYDALNEIKRCLLEAQTAHARAMSTLTMAEQKELADNLVSTFSGDGCINGHTIPNRSYGRRLTDIMRKMDRTGIHDAAEALIPLTNQSLLDLLAKLPDDAFPTVTINGQRVQRFSTSAGDIIIGGREDNVYDLDSPEMRDVVCVIDLGGNDTYREGTCNLNRPVLAIIDLGGNDMFTASRPGVQGGSVLGVSIVVNATGNNTYSANDVAQGSTLGGAGMLFNLDDNGNDSYRARRRAQGHALCGLGVLVDRGGNDKYRAALWAQGYGAPGGFGILENVKGNDHYYCGGLWIDSYPEHPGYDGWGQGVGAGIRQVANGGIGVLLDGEGDDQYEVDYFGHGGGYWLGVGFCRDFGGNDRRPGTTLTAFDGGPRRERQWTRFSNGWGCHYALGYVFDDAGDDVYGGQIMGSGMGWDLAIGFLCNFGGNNTFNATGGMTQGVGAEGSIGVLYCYGGNNTFNGRNQAFASSNLTYHTPSNCGGNFSFLITHGGQNKYGSGAKPRSYTQRGTPGGFLIDRPTQAEAADELVPFQKLVAERQKQIEEFDEAQKKIKADMEARNRRYVPPRTRPQPIAPNQQRSIGAVPNFGASTAKSNENTVK